jgi:PBP1b-binding outer membrane lipoprotein LpoB
MKKLITAVMLIFLLAACQNSEPAGGNDFAEPVFAEEAVVSTYDFSDMNSDTKTQTEDSSQSDFTTANTSETTANITAEPVVSDSEVITLEPILYLFEDDYDERVESLFTAFVNHDKTELKRLSNARSDGIFDFVDNITFGDYKITSGEIFAESGSIHRKNYTVELEVKESGHPRFPVGINTYKIAALDAGIGPFFSPLTFENETETVQVYNLSYEKNELSENARICYNFTLEMLPFYGRTSADNFTIPTEETTWFYGCMERFFSHLRPPVGIPHTPDGYNAAAKEILGIDANFDEKTIEPLWYGANYSDAVIVSEDENSIIIDWYADALLFQKAFTIKYNFDTTDGFRLTSIENIYNSGFDETRYTT